MSQDLSTTSYALLGLLVLDGPEAPGLTGYELKQRADRTLRFYWVSPAMSQVYSELDRLGRHGLVSVAEEQSGRRRTRRFRLTPAGMEAIRTWLASSDITFPILKHPVALRLLMGGLLGPERVRELLTGYLEQLADRRGDLVGVRASLGDVEGYRYPALVAEWGLDYYDAEAATVEKLIKRLDQV